MRFWFKRKPRYRVIREPAVQRIMMLEHCLAALRECLAPEIARGHEGVAFLYGKTDGTETLITGVFRPQARTTRGSFAVSTLAMAKVVEAVCDLGLEVIGQIHSHPTLAGHSKGDEDGARIAYDGFVSLVLPNYARDLPSLEGMAIYMYRDGEFDELEDEALLIIPGSIK